MVAMTVGGRMSHYGPRGVNGTIDDILWPIQHGVLFYPGFDVVPPSVFYEVSRAEQSAVDEMTAYYIERLLTMDSAEPIPFRAQNNGDYDDLQVLKPELAGDAHGHALHQRSPAYVSNTWLGISGDYTRRHIAPSSRDGEK